MKAVALLKSPLGTESMFWQVLTIATVIRLQIDLNSYYGLRIVIVTKGTYLVYVFSKSKF